MEGSNMTKTLINRILFWEKHEIFLKIIGIEPPMQDMQEYGEMLHLVSLEDGTEGVCHWVIEIGEEFTLVPVNFSGKLAVQYCDAAKTSREARDLMLNIECDMLQAQWSQ